MSESYEPLHMVVSRFIYVFQFLEPEAKALFYEKNNASKNLCIFRLHETNQNF